MKKILSVGIAGLGALLVSLMLVGCLANPPVGAGAGGVTELPVYGKIGPEAAARLLLTLGEDPNFVLLDIRTPAEVATGHISGATNLDFYDPQFSAQLAQLDRDKMYLIYCRTGNRTGQAWSTMARLGFAKVYDLEGGIRDWIALGYPICLGPLSPDHVCIGALPDADS